MHQNTTENPPVRTVVRIAAYALMLVVIVGGLELGLRLVFPNAPDPLTKQQVATRLNSPEENRTDLPLHLARQGGACVHREPKFHWNPRFGFNSKTLDKRCAKNLFASGTTSVVMLGGSTMAGAGASNYLTTLDYYAFGDNESIVSINLAEPGARLWNMMARFIEEVVDLKPSFVVFLGGATEFYAMHYGGQPGDDTHWAYSVRRRVESPQSAMIEAILNRSRLLQVTMNAIGAGSRRDARFNQDRVDEDAAYYLRARDAIQALCRHYGVRCLFILAPMALLEENPTGTTAAIVDENLKYFPDDRKVFTRGFELIRQGGGADQIDASRLFYGHADTYLDVAHFSKVGNAILGKFIYSAIMKAGHEVPPMSQ